MRRLLLFFSPGRLILAVALLVTGYLLFSAGGNFIQHYRIADDEAELRARVDEMHSQEAQLEQIREYLRSDEYIEFMARRVFGLVKPGETLVIVHAPPGDEPKEGPPGRPWWQDLFGR